MGTRREVKTHWFTSAGNGTTQGVTSCGVECWITPQSKYEADTAAGNRIEVSSMFPFHVTCDKCIKIGMPTKPTAKL